MFGGKSNPNSGRHTNRLSLSLSVRIASNVRWKAQRRCGPSSDERRRAAKTAPQFEFASRKRSSSQKETKDRWGSGLSRKFRNDIRRKFCWRRKIGWVFGCFCCGTAGGGGWGGFKSPELQKKVYFRAFLSQCAQLDGGNAVVVPTETKKWAWERVAGLEVSSPLQQLTWNSWQFVFLKVFWRWILHFSASNKSWKHLSTAKLLGAL